MGWMMRSARTAESVLQVFTQLPMLATRIAESSPLIQNISLVTANLYVCSSVRLGLSRVGVGGGGGTTGVLGVLGVLEDCGLF